jgi:hypothetical protein
MSHWPSWFADLAVVRLTLMRQVKFFIYQLFAYHGIFCLLVQLNILWYDVDT